MVVSLVSKYDKQLHFIRLVESPISRLRHNPSASIVNSFRLYGLWTLFEILILRSEFSCSCAVNTRIIITYYKQTVIILKLAQNKTNRFEIICHHVILSNSHCIPIYVVKKAKQQVKITWMLHQGIGSSTLVRWPYHWTIS